MNGRSKSALLAGRWAVSPATVLATGQERPMPHGTHCTSSSSDPSWIAESAMKVSPCENLAHHAPASVTWPRFYRSSFANAFSQWLRAKSQRSPLCKALAALTLSRGILVLAKSASLARRCPGLLWDSLSLTGLSNPGMNCYQIQLEYKCPQVELYKASYLSEEDHHPRLPSQLCLAHSSWYSPTGHGSHAVDAPEGWAYPGAQGLHTYVRPLPSRRLAEKEPEPHALQGTSWSLGFNSRKYYRTCKPEESGIINDK